MEWKMSRHEIRNWLWTPIQPLSINTATLHPATPQPVSAPRPTTNTPQSNKTTPRPAAITPRPATATPRPTTTSRRPVTVVHLAPTTPLRPRHLPVVAPRSISVTALYNPAQEVMTQQELVAQILQHLLMEDIRSFATINSVWAQEVQSHSLLWSHVDFSGDNLETTLDNYCNEMQDNCHGRVSFGKIMTEEDSIAIVKFATKYKNKIQEVSLILDGSEDILYAFDQVTSLILELDEDVRNENLPEGLVMENVKRLTVLVDYKNGPWNVSPVLSYLAFALIRMVPSLEHLTLHDETQDRMLKNLILSEEGREKPSSLKSLSLIGRDSRLPVVSKPILDLPFQLSLLELDFKDKLNNVYVFHRCQKWSGQELENVLYKYGPTLRHLSLHNIWSITGCNPQNVKLRIMPNLVRLEITYHLQFPNANIPRPHPIFKFRMARPSASNFPKLEQIKVEQLGTVSKRIVNENNSALNWYTPSVFLDMFFSTTGKSYPSVKRVYLNDLRRKSPSNRTKCFHQFPNATVFHNF